MREIDFKVQKLDENFFVLGNAYACLLYTSDAADE